MAWTDDGANLALGHYDGAVSIRDKAGGERLRLDCGASPVWSLTWSLQVSPAGLMLRHTCAVKCISDTPDDTPALDKFSNTGLQSICKDVHRS